MFASTIILISVAISSTGCRWRRRQGDADSHKCEKHDVELRHLADGEEMRHLHRRKHVCHHRIRFSMAYVKHHKQHRGYSHHVDKPVIGTQLLAVGYQRQRVGESEYRANSHHKHRLEQQSRVHSAAERGYAAKQVGQAHLRRVDPSKRRGRPHGHHDAHKHGEQRAQREDAHLENPTINTGI